jgi:hypothetical protein
MPSVRLIGKPERYEADRGRHHHLDQVRECVDRELLKVSAPLTLQAWLAAGSADKGSVVLCNSACVRSRTGQPSARPLTLRYCLGCSTQAIGHHDRIDVTVEKFVEAEG